MSRLFEAITQLEKMQKVPSEINEGASNISEKAHHSYIRSSAVISLVLVVSGFLLLQAIDHWSKKLTVIQDNSHIEIQSIKRATPAPRPAEKSLHSAKIMKVEDKPGPNSDKTSDGKRQKYEAIPANNMKQIRHDSINNSPSIPLEDQLDLKALLQQAEEYREKGLLSKARRIYEEYLRIRFDPAVANNLAAIYLTIKRPFEAKRLLERAIEKNPLDPDLKENMKITKEMITAIQYQGKKDGSSQ